MPNTKLVAKIKKIDINNKVTAENWSQSITILLSDIELNDENLVAIRKFKPNEEISVSFETLQLSMLDDRPYHNEIIEVEEDFEEPEELFVIDYEEELPETDKVVKTFQL